MKTIAVVILNWNGKSFLSKFLPKVIACSPSNAEIIIADNGSSDNSVDFIQTNFPHIKIVINDKNYGFAGGYNEALKHISAKYYVLLNSDVEVTPNWLEPLYSLLENNPEIAACQPKLRAYNDRDFFEYAGAAGGFIDKYGYPFCRGRILYKLEKDIGQYDDITEIFWATGACLFVRSEIFHQVGGFDTDFFAHMEEIDLCWRMKKQGYKIYYCGQSTVFHVGGGTLNKSNPRKTYYNFRNSLMALVKNSETKHLYSAIAFRLAFDFVAGIKLLLTDGIYDTMAIVKAHWYFFFNIQKIFNLRKKELSLVKKSNVTGIMAKSLIFQFYLYRKKEFLAIKKYIKI